ncbi:MAG: M4 family metallopeptidase [Candidatus Eisenbacteria bacterium]
MNVTRFFPMFLFLFAVNFAAVAAAEQNPVVRTVAGHEVTLRVTGVANRCAKANVSEEAARGIANAFLREHAADFGLSDPGQQLLLAQNRTDDLGQTHLVYHQTHMGLPVVNGAVRVHLNPAGQVYLAYGKIASDLPAGVTPAVSFESAEAIAEDAARALLGIDRDAVIERPELAIRPLGFDTDTPDPDVHLVWQMFVEFPKCGTPECEGPAAYVVVDARNGEVLLALPAYQGLERRSYDCATFWGEYTCWVNTVGTDSCIHGRSEGEPARGPFCGPEWIQYGSTDVDSSYAIVGRIHQWVGQSFGLNGANNQGGLRNYPGYYYLTVVFDYLEGWDGMGAPGFCPGGAGLTSPNYSIMLCLDMAYRDVIAHEYAHGIAHWAFPGAGADLNSVTARALSESHSDIMGETFEYDDNGSTDWLAGSEAAGGPWRSLSSPHDILGPYGHADRFYDPYFNCDGDPNTGGFYANSTVYSHVMYLAAEGGGFNGCEIQGQGMEFVKQVFHRSWRTYFDRSQSFTTADDRMLQACADLYDSSACAELRKALQAGETDQPGRCIDPDGIDGEEAPPCALNHTGVALTTRSNGTPTTEFYAGEDLWLAFTGATPDRTLDFQLLPADPFRPKWQETASLAIETGSGTVQGDGTLAAFAFTLPAVGDFDVLIDGNRDGHYQPWADQVLTITVNDVDTDVEDGASMPLATRIEALTPNPAPRGAAISFTLAHAGPVALQIFDVTGRLVTTLESGILPAGSHLRDWSGGSARTGVYFVRLKSADHTDTQKLVIVR